MSVIDNSENIKVLGCSWNHKDDFIFVDFAYNPQNRITKREILKTLASIHDPNGILGPFTIRCKFIIQELWLRSKDLKEKELLATWAEEVPKNLETDFRKWSDKIPSMKEIKISRYFGFDKQKQGEIFGFADASLRGIACVIYNRVKTASGNYKFFFIASRSRVAPIGMNKLIEAISVPRLELLAGLLAEIKETVFSACESKSTHPVFLFTDSETVLCQISGKNA